MTRPFAARADEDKLTAQLFEALGSSLDVRTILREAYPLLTRLIPADYGALGVSATAEAEGFEWTVAELPEAFFATYAEMAAHDFVRHAVTAEPRRVLRDQEMIARPELEQNLLYRRARELGVPLEQVMAVMLHIDDRWQSGLSLYRDRTRPFSGAERARLQRITPALANAVRNCHQFGVAADWKLALERMLPDPEAAVVLAADNGGEIARSEGASQLLERWFEPHERRGSRLPKALARAVQQAASTTAPGTWIARRSGHRLEVSFARLAGYFGDNRWLLRLEERAEGDPAAAAWRLKLTKREREIVQGVQQGWDNRMIGDELGCSEGTVKKHLSNVFTKLGIKSRTALVVALAASHDLSRPTSARKS